MSDPFAPDIAAPDPGALALAALETGQQALAAGAVAAALRWLDRACRLAPDDPTPRLALAAACLRYQPARAASLFAGVAAARRPPEAWFALAAARRACGDPAGAAAALAAALCRHVVSPGFTELADAIAREAGAKGWCGVLAGPRIAIRPVDPSDKPDVRLDGAPRPADARPPDARPPDWPEGYRLSARIGGTHLLGSPLQLDAIGRIEGMVAARDGGLKGWAWHPADPDRDPVITVHAADRRQTLRLTATDRSVAIAGAGVLARPRGFYVAPAALRGFCRPLQVCGADGKHLLGSPLDPDWRPSRARTRPSVAPAHNAAAHNAPATMPQRRRQPAVVIPVHGGGDVVLACLRGVLRTVPAATWVIVVDDASPEPALRRVLERLAQQRRIRLIRHVTTRGFPASANAGLEAARGRDAVLLNSDTLVAPGWLARLRAAAYSAADIGTVTPLSNNASIVSYPGPAGSNSVPDARATRRLAALAWRANDATTVDIPVGVGFCLYLRRDCLEAVGPLRTDLFAQGYGEENDFCLRARRAGWRHVAAPGVFVAHVAGASFGPAGEALRTRNQTLLERLHPDYGALIARHLAEDPLAAARRRLDLARWRASRRRGGTAAVLITHADGGGVERRVIASCAAHRDAGRRAVVLRPGGAEHPGVVRVSDGPEDHYPNLRYALPQERPALLRLLRAERPALVELHHLLGHHPAVADMIDTLGAPLTVHVHDHAWFCPRVVLIGADRRYCGEPDLAGCEACVRRNGSLLDDGLSVTALRQRSAQLLTRAARVVAPSRDTAARLRRHFADIALDIVPHESDTALAAPSPPAARPKDRCRVCVIGAIGIAKGYEVLLGCARDAAARDRPLEFVVVGHTIDDEALLATGRVFVTGPFRAEDAAALIRTQQADLALLPSIWPETWCFALSDAWRAGLNAAVFALGAQAERVARTGKGFLLDPNMPAAGINDALLAAACASRHECRSHRDRGVSDRTPPGGGDPSTGIAIAGVRA